MIAAFNEWGTFENTTDIEKCFSENPSYALEIVTEFVHDETAPLREEIERLRNRRVCPNCNKLVEVRIVPYNPDDQISESIYECIECNEGFDFV